MSVLAHPSDGDLLALLDGELPGEPGERRADALRHARECSACNDRLTELEHASETTDELLDLLVQPEPALQLSSVLQRARREQRWRAALIAASVTLVVAATAGATVGRPFVRAVAVRIWAAVHPSRGATPPTAPERGGGGAQAGVAVIPGAVAEIVFDATQSSGVLRVSLVDTAELAIRSSAPVTYRVYQGRVIVHNQGSGASYDVIIPRAAPHVRIAIGGRVILEKTGLQVVTASAADSAGQYVITIQ